MTMKDIFRKMFSREFENPKAGEMWGYIQRGNNPWEETTIVSLRVKEVKNGWVCWNYDFEKINWPCNSKMNYVTLISDFKENYARVEWLKTQL